MATRLSQITSIHGPGPDNFASSGGASPLNPLTADSAFVYAVHYITIYSGSGAGVIDGVQLYEGSGGRSLGFYFTLSGSLQSLWIPMKRPLIVKALNLTRTAGTGTSFFISVGYRKIPVG